jgi:DnaJ-class molecular chaperone
MNYYQILDIDRHATSTDIRNAYKRLALRWHPDRNTAKEAEEKFKTIKQAYDILSDERRRDEYDRELSHVSYQTSPRWFETGTSSQMRTHIDER